MIWATVLISGLFLGMLILLEVGRRIGRYKLKMDPKGFHKGITGVENAVFGLLGLFIAFTFSGALTRWDARRSLITEEVNAVGTAFLRIDLIPSEKQTEMKNLFRQYVDTRIETYKYGNSETVEKAKLDQGAKLQSEIWALAITSCKSPDASVDAGKLLLPALNTMIDITTTRVVASETHPPFIVFNLLFLMSLFSALLAGYDLSGGKTMNILHMAVLAIIIPLTVYIILDIEYPNQGLFRIDMFDKYLIDLRTRMG